MAAAQGNQYAAKAKRWTMAIERALEKRSRGDMVQALDDLAEKLLVAADAGEQWALKELGDRLEGKAAQQLQLTGNDGGPVQFEKIVREIVDTPNQNA